MRPVVLIRVPVITLLAVLAFTFIALFMGISVEGATSQSDILRRLGLAPFAYVAETEHDYSNIQQNTYELYGKLAIIDFVSDLLTDSIEPDMSTITTNTFNVFSFEAGSSLQEVAVSPDGTRIYVTDAYQPYLHIFDAENHQYLLAVELPGVEPKTPLTMEDMMRYNPMSDKDIPYSLFFENCSSDVACRPDGLTILISTSAGLQIIDAETNLVIKTLTNINGTLIAVSFDGSRAYIGTDSLVELEPRSYAEWFELIFTSDDFSLLILDLQSWEVIAEIKTYAIGGIAVRPDKPEVYFSESFQKRVRVVDALTLDDIYQFSTEPSFSYGIGFLPDGSKAYSVCAADVSLPFLEQTTDSELPKAEDFFCAVFDTKAKQLIKKIPLEAY